MTVISNAFLTVCDSLRANGKTVIEKGDRATAQCPAHDDSTPSLSIGPRRDAKGVVLSCHAGCDYGDVLAAIGLTDRDLFDDSGLRDSLNPNADYRYVGGRVKHRRKAPDGKKMWQSGDMSDRSLYGVEHLVEDGSVVYVCEGEKAAGAVRALGVAAVATGGAKATPDFSPLRDRIVLAVVDRDQAGLAWAHRVRAELTGIAASISFVQSRVNAPHADVVEHIAADLDLSDLEPVDLGDGTAAADDEQVDGAQVLDEVETWFGRFIRVAFDGDLALLALWAAHTHLAAELYTTPRLQLDSTMPESGKTTVLDHFSRLCQRPVQVANLSSPALIPRLLESGIRTLLIDEVDRSLRPDGPNVPELIGIINSGYRAGAKRPVLVPVKGGGWDVSEMSTHAPVALAGNSPNLPDDTKSRCLRILLMPDFDGTVEDSDWEIIEDDAAELADNLRRFADQVRDRVKGMIVELPSKCVGRAKEKWRPLKRVAVAAGGRWPALADKLIARGLAEDAAERESGLRNLPPGVVLLNDLHAVWPDGDDLVPTRDLVRLLIGHNLDYWGEQSRYGKALTEHRFGKLANQAAKATSVRPGGRGPRGFLRSQFEPTWTQHRIGAPPTGESGASGESGESGIKTGSDNRFNRSSQLHHFQTGVPEAVTEPVTPDAGHTRRPFCKGCGTYWATHGEHRADCTASKQTQDAR